MDSDVYSTLCSLLCEGVALDKDADKLILHRQGAALDSEILDLARQHKQGLLDYLDTPSATVMDRILNVARSKPGSPALVDGITSITYSNLVGTAQRCAGKLRMEASIRPGSRVIVLLEPGTSHLIVVLSLFLVGATVVPVDLKQPRSRIAALAEQADPALVIYEADHEAALAGWTGSTICLSEILPDLSDNNQDRVPDDLKPCFGPAAYLLFTSGSTGRPKGVLIGHEALLASINSLIRVLGLDEATRFAAVASPGFDIAWLEWLGPLMCGGQVHFPPASSGLHPGQRVALLCQWLNDGSVNCLQATPSLWRLLLMQGFSVSAESKLLCGGETMTPALARALLDAGGQVFNLYGPTEATIWSTCHNVVSNNIDSSGFSVPVGQTLPHMRHLIDSHKGNELLLAGTGLALGYFRDRALNRSAFVWLPRDTRMAGAKVRCYRTGDRVRLDLYGQLIFCDRLDRQVKINGYRIELTEIEQALERHSSVASAAVVTEAVMAEPERQRLVAHVVAVRGSHNKTADKLNTFIGQALPSWMLPERYAFHDALPLTLNGKVDYPSLRQMTAEACMPDGVNLATENRIRQCMHKLLGRRAIGRHDSFFDVGGSSILAASLLLMINRCFSVELPLSAILSTPPTIAGLAAIVDQAMPEKQDALHESI